MSIQGKEWKEWAREHMRGVENVTTPSFTADLKKLDERGIRWDIQQAIRHGFYSTGCTGDWALTFDERKRLLDIMADEGRGKIELSLMANQAAGSWPQMIDLLQHAAGVGFTHATIWYPAWFYPESLEEIYVRTRELCEAANLGIVLWATASDDHYRFHPSSVPFSLFDRLVEIPNVIGMKVGFAEPAMVFEVFERYADKIQVNCGHPSMFGMYPALLEMGHRPQWAGTGIWEIWQSPEKPYIVEMFDHFVAGRIDDAMKLYWFLVEQNAFRYFGGYEDYNIGALDTWHGMPAWVNAKYAIWSVGGNGGPVRQPAKSFRRDFMAQRKGQLRRLEIEPREPDAEFFVGRVNYTGG